MSYVLSTNTLPRSSTNAEFQAWGKQISDAIANCGIIRESNANVGTQIDWSTVAAPSASNQSRGYEIYKFNDAMQATTPVYFKIEYGSASSNAIPSLWMTWGSGANVSGNVTGNTTTRQQLVSVQKSSNVTSYYSGSSNRFCMSYAIDDTSALCLGMERTLDANGNVTADGLAIVVAYYGSTTKLQVTWTPTTGNVTAFETTLGILTPGASINSGLFRGVPGHHLAAYPIFFNNGAQLYPPQTMFLAYFNGEFTTGAQSLIPVYGADVPYMPLGNGNIHTVSARGGNRTAFMMRWD